MPPIQVTYEKRPLATLLNDLQVVAVFGFGSGAATSSDPRYLRIRLEPINADPIFEVWRSTKTSVRYGCHNEIRWASDGDYLFGAIELEESAYGNIENATEFAYRKLFEFIENNNIKHLLKAWNYIDAINQGSDDEERYRLFCTGRARAIHEYFTGTYPAATAIGQRDGKRVLQLYWLASHLPAQPIENPRQVSAWDYPRQYGPAAPMFARAVLSPAKQLLISGTAAIVGHASQHEGHLGAQLEETLTNLNALCGASDRAKKTHFGCASLLKAYVRQRQDAPYVEETLSTAYPRLGGLLLLEGDICRRDLLVEVDGIAG